MAKEHSVVYAWEKGFDLNEGFQSLLRSSEFHQLQALKPDLNIFDALGVKWREHSHSDLLAYLLSPEKANDLGDSFLRAFVLEAMQASPVTEGRKNLVGIDSLASFSTVGARVYREWRHIDLLIELPNMDLAIGIENKIFAAEQKEQLERYQESLEEHSFSHSLMVFLTPDGRRPITGKEKHDTPCVYLGWPKLADLLEDVRPASAAVHVDVFVDQVLGHIREDIMGESSESAIVSKILGNPELARTIQKIRQHAPKLEDRMSEIKGIANRVLGEGRYRIQTHPEKRGAKVEVKIQPTEDSGLYGGFRPVFMVYHYPDWHVQPFPAVLLSQQSGKFDAVQDRYGKLADRSPDLSDSPAKVPDWGGYWLNLAEKDSRISEFGYIIEDMGLGDKFLKEVEEALSLYNRILTDAASCE